MIYLCKGFTANCALHNRRATTVSYEQYVKVTSFCSSGHTLQQGYQLLRGKLQFHHEIEEVSVAVLSAR
jgi:hypothetical protein